MPPLKATFPEKSVSAPVNIRSRVVFPAPFRPIKPIFSPLSKLAEIPSRITEPAKSFFN